MRLIIGLLVAIVALFGLAFLLAKGEKEGMKKAISVRSERKKEEEATKVDSAEIKRLSPRFKLKVDEFDKDSLYSHITRPAYVNRNGMFTGFKMSDGRPSSLFLNIQYFAEEWLFIHKYQFLLGDSSYTVVPFNVQRDNGDGNIWEWSSIRIDKDHEALMQQFGKASTGKIRFSGQQYEKVKPLTKQQMRDIYEGYVFFKAMGGTIK